MKRSPLRSVSRKQSVRRRERTAGTEALRAAWVAGKPPACDAHHVIPKAWLRKVGFGEDAVWDVRNRVWLERHRHEQVTNHHKPLTRAELPAAVWEFAAEYGLTWKLERECPE